MFKELNIDFFELMTEVNKLSVMVYLARKTEKNKKARKDIFTYVGCMQENVYYS